MVDVVQEMRAEAETLAQGLEEAGQEVEIGLGGPDALLRHPPARGLVEGLLLAHAIDAAQARNAGLRPDRPIAFLDMARHLVRGLFRIPAISVAIDHHPGAALAA